MRIAISSLVKLALWNIGAFVVGIGGASLFNSLAFLAFGVGAVGLITFFGMLEPSLSGGDTSDGHIRRAVTVTVVAVYAVFVASLAFFDVELPAAQGVVRNFTTLTAVVVAFYFSSSAYLDARRTGGVVRATPRKAAAPRKRTAN